MDNLSPHMQPIVSDDKQNARHEALKTEFLAGNAAKVIQLADVALGHVHDDSEALFWKAAALLQQKKYKEAIPFASEASVENSFNVRYFALLSLLYLKNGDSESAVLIAGKGLALKPNDLACLEIKAVALVSLFRLQEAQPVIQKVIQLKSAGTVHEQPVFTAEGDAELLYEQALTIDPFKTKSRLDNFNTLKLQHPAYRLLRKITLTDRSKALVGLFILMSLFAAVTYFFREGATYHSFSPLFFILLWRGMAVEKSIIAATNFKFFFKGDFRMMLQRQDTTLTIKGVAYYLIAFTGFFLWHSTQSWIGLIASIISGGLFAVLEDGFAPGNKLQAVPVTVSKRSRTIFRQLEQLPYDDVYRLTMRSLPRQILSSGITAKIFKYGLLVMLVWPVLFMIIRLFTDAATYRLLLYTEMAIVICIILSISLYRIAGLRYFFPADARHFVPAEHVKTAQVVSSLWILLVASIALHFVLHNELILLATGLLAAAIFRISLKKRTTSPEDTDRKAQLLVYVRNNISPQEHRQ